jgi:hypothetical protein
MMEEEDGVNLMPNKRQPILPDWENPENLGNPKVYPNSEYNQWPSSLNPFDDSDE